MLQPGGFTLTANEQAANSTSGPHAKSAFRQPRSRVHSSSHEKDNAPTPGSTRSAGERHISFNTFVTQCIAIQPGEHMPGVFDDEDDEADRAPADWEDALSVASSESHARRPALSRSISRSNSHSSDLSERLTIAPIPPTLLKLKDEDPEDDDGGGFMMGGGNKAAKENGHGRRAREGPVLVYAPPTGSDSVYAPRDVNHPGVVEADAAVFDYFDSGEHRRHHHRYGSRHGLPDGGITVEGEITVGGSTHRNDLSNGSSQNHNIDNVGGGKQVYYSTRVLNRDQLLGDPAADKAGINAPSIISTSAVYASMSGASSTSTLQQAKQERAQEERESEASIGGTTTPPIPIPRSPLSSSPAPSLDTPHVIYGVDERRGRTLVRTSSASSLNERVKNNAGSIGVSVGSIGNGNGSGMDISPVGSLSPESSRASSSRGSSAGTGAGLGRGRGVSKLDTSKQQEDISSGIPPTTNEAAKLEPSSAVPPTPPSPTSSGGVGSAAGLVDKAKGILGTLLGHSSATVAPATNTTTATPPPPSPRRSQF